MDDVRITPRCLQLSQLKVRELLPHISLEVPSGIHHLLVLIEQRHEVHRLGTS